MFKCIAKSLKGKDVTGWYCKDVFGKHIIERWEKRSPDKEDLHHYDPIDFSTLRIIINGKEYAPAEVEMAMLVYQARIKEEHL